MPDTCGRTSPRQFAFYDPDASCWRTSEVISLWGSEPFSATWPKRGSMRSGACYAHRTWEPPTVELVSSSLLPTPVVNDMGAGKTVEAWDDWTAKMQAKHGNGNGHGRSLAIETARLLPTPTVDDAGNITRESGDFQSLTRSVRLLPTPNASDFKGATTPEAAKDWEHRGVNLPERIQRLRGASTSPPSDDGSASSDGHLPGQLTIMDASPPPSLSG